MDRLDELEVLLAILEAGSLTGAARRLRRSAPSITRSLAALEKRLGARLVERSTRNLAPTEAGLRLAEHARRVLADYAQAVQEDPAAPLRGTLRVTAPHVFGRRHVSPVVISYLKLYPMMRVELVFNDHNLDLIEEGLDVAVRIGPLADTSLVARRVGEVSRLLVASPDYLQARGTPRTLSDLEMHDTIFTDGRIASLEWRFRQAGRDRVLRPAPRLIVNEIDAMLLAVKAGQGLGRPLSYQVADELQAGTLVRLLAEFESEPLPVQLVVPSARYMAPKLRAFLDHAVQMLETLDVIRPL
ncbi:LysR family transcriptional regulator [Paralcaligenes ginsengisoli]